MNIPVLCYHSMAIEGNDYGNNDHVALASDIKQLAREGFRILPLHEITRLWLEAPDQLEGCRIVGLTCDDGGDFDFTDLPHPVAGVQRSFIGIVRDASRSMGQPAHITSFVIVSPAAREILDVACMIGKGWWNEHWWRPAVDSGLMGVANHSWDHNHDCVPETVFPGLRRGTFNSIDDERLADHQIGRASEYLWNAVPSPSAGLFAYPYGESNDYLVREYFPVHAQRIRVTAAFDDQGEPLTRDSNRWALPRFVFRRDWKAPEELARILRDAAS
jgi:Polysaccharide deacetylase